MLPLSALVAALALLPLSFATGADTAGADESCAPPEELWSPLVSQKFYATAVNVSATQYPQYTDRTYGLWIDFDVDIWTSGFLPAALYAMHTREALCPGLASDPPVDWLALGRAWSGGLSALEVHNTVGHDVGFISFPLLEELKMWAQGTSCCDSSGADSGLQKPVEHDRSGRGQGIRPNPC